MVEAEELLPRIERSMREAVVLKSEIDQAQGVLQDASQRVMLLGGSLVNRAALVAERGRRDTSAARLNEIVEGVHSLGCQIKDLDTGLVDFPSLYRGQEVLLCWRLGEARIGFWHGVEEGFRGRKPIDAEFLAHHEGERAD